MALRPPIPNVVLVYGLLGLLPFVAAPLASLAAPLAAGAAADLQASYGALILSFLGGARWGLEVVRPAPRVVVVSLAMLPTLAALALLVMPMDIRASQIMLVMLLLVHWFWDWRSEGLPGWYPQLRSLLTAGAVAGVAAQAILMSRGL